MLSDKEIEARIKSLCQDSNGSFDSGMLITPFDKKRLGPVSYDLTTEVVDQKRGVKRLVTKETINMPRDLAGIVSARSRLEMRGLFAAFSFLVDPGYEGKLTFLVWRPEEPNKDYDASDLFQIMFFKVGEVEQAYNERPSSTAMGRKGFNDQAGKESSSLQDTERSI